MEDKPHNKNQTPKSTIVGLKTATDSTLPYHFLNHLSSLLKKTEIFDKYTIQKYYVKISIIKNKLLKNIPSRIIL